MKNVLPILAMTVLTPLGLAARPGLAADEQTVDFTDFLMPTATMAHPDKKELAVVVTDQMDLAACDFWYEHWRWPVEGSQGLPALESGGEIEVSLKRVRGRRKREIARQVSAVWEKSSGRRIGIVAWADSPVICDWCAAGYGFTFETSKEFPLHVEPGDVLLWTVTFSSMPELESTYFHTKCSTCGSIRSTA